jgi:hypothetical protein
MPQFFHDSDGVSAHDAFQRWRQDNSRGFFLNCRTQAEVMLHRAACSHVGEADEGAEVWGSMTHKSKVCSTDAQELREWASERGARLETCSSCKPAQR